MCNFSVVILFMAMMAVNFWSASCVTEEEKAAMLTAIAPLAKNCAAKCGLDDEDFEKYKNKNTDMDPCFKLCLMTQIGIMTDDGKYDGKGLHKTIAEDYPGDEENAMKYLDQLDRCFDAKGDNNGSDEESKMKRADVLFQCMKEMEKHN